jgi:hypothetical protein
VTAIASSDLPDRVVAALPVQRFSFANPRRRPAMFLRRTPVHGIGVR